jgi:hypothetical protein
MTYLEEVCSSSIPKSVRGRAVYLHYGHREQAPPTQRLDQLAGDR